MPAYSNSAAARQCVLTTGCGTVESGAELVVARVVAGGETLQGEVLDPETGLVVFRGIPFAAPPNRGSVGAVRSGSVLSATPASSHFFGYSPQRCSWSLTRRCRIGDPRLEQRGVGFGALDTGRDIAMLHLAVPAQSSLTMIAKSSESQTSSVFEP